MAKWRMEFVYFVRAVGVGRIKIGVSESPWGRIRALSTSCPVPIEVLGVIEGGLDFELYLHRKFAALRRNGEWFEEAPEILDFIEARTSPLPPEAEIERRLETIVRHSGQERTLREWSSYRGVPVPEIKKRLLAGYGEWHSVFTPLG